MRISRWVVVSAVVLFGALAHADRNADAKRFYASGNQHFALAEYEQAIADFKEAFRLKEDPVFLYNIAQCYRQLPQQEDNAIRFYRTYLARTAQTPNREEVERWIVELEQRRAAQLQGQPQQPPQQPMPEPQPQPQPQPQPYVEAPPQVPLQWMPGANGSIPPGAFAAGGENGRALTICQARHQGGLHPGKVVGKNCNFGYGGVEVTLPSYNVLVGDPRFIAWAPSTSAASASPVQGGNEADGTPLVICRATWNGGLHPGKVVGGQCAIGWGGKEVNVPQYEVLVVGQPTVSAPPPRWTKKQDIEAGPLWNDDHAKRTCPSLCSQRGGVWGGAWRTTVPSKMSVCSCSFSR